MALQKKPRTKTIQISPGRRAFLRGAAISAPVALAASAVGAAGSQGESYQPRYFSTLEWTTLSALVDRLIPPDEQGPGAVQAGVPEFIDRQMNTPYGHGALWYMAAPFHPDVSELFGYQLGYAPRDLYRKALAGLAQTVQSQFGKTFSELDADQQDKVIGAMENGKLSIGEVPAAAFFGQLLANTHEGYFCDPIHGGNKDKGGWKLVGFPGARADYLDWVEQYGKRYPLPPVSRA